MFFKKLLFFSLLWENGQFQTNLLEVCGKRLGKWERGRRLITICIIDRAACCNLVPTFTVNFYSICSVGALVPCLASQRRFRNSASRIYCQLSGIIQRKSTGLWLILELLHFTVLFFFFFGESIYMWGFPVLNPQSVGILYRLGVESIGGEMRGQEFTY